MFTYVLGRYVASTCFTSSQTFRTAPTAPLPDSCSEIKSAPSMAQAILAEFGGRFREAMLGVSFRGAVPDGEISRGLAAPVVSEGIVDDDVTASGHMTSVMTSTLLWLDDELMLNVLRCHLTY